MKVFKNIFLIEFFSASETVLNPLALFLIISLLPLYFLNFKKKRKVFLGDGG